VKVDELLHVLHLRVEGQFHAPEQVGYHLCTNEIVVMESPSNRRVPTFRLRFAHIVQQGSPSQPQVVGVSANVVKHLQRVIEVVFVRTAIARFHIIEPS